MKADFYVTSSDYNTEQELVPPVIIGALCAVLIGAFATMIGLLIAKENKTSEFRQEWIDNLRDEIAQFLVNFNAIADATHAEYADLSSKLIVLSPLYRDLNEAAFKISLRLNSDEEPSQEVLRALAAIQALGVDEETLKTCDITPLESDLLIKAKNLLKAEWVRVKQGEQTYRRVVKTSLIAVPLLIVALLVLIFGGFVQTGERDRDRQLSPERTKVIPERLAPPLLPTPSSTPYTMRKDAAPSATPSLDPTPITR